VNTITASNLAEMTISMLERTAMVLAEPVTEELDRTEPMRSARIRYRGPSEGVLFLSATDQFLRELAASLLGVETADVNVDTQGSDALREMANIVGGSVILAMSGDVCEYSLGLPELVAADQVPASAAAECTVAADGGVLRALWVQSSAAQAA